MEALEGILECDYREGIYLHAWKWSACLTEKDSRRSLLIHTLAGKKAHKAGLIRLWCIQQHYQSQFAGKWQEKRWVCKHQTSSAGWIQLQLWLNFEYILSTSVVPKKDLGPLYLKTSCTLPTMGSTGLLTSLLTNSLINTLGISNPMKAKWLKQSGRKHSSPYPGGKCRKQCFCQTKDQRYSGIEKNISFIWFKRKAQRLTD